MPSRRRAPPKKRSFTDYFDSSSDDDNFSPPKNTGCIKGKAAEEENSDIISIHSATPTPTTSRSTRRSLQSTSTAPTLENSSSPSFPLSYAISQNMDQGSSFLATQQPSPNVRRRKEDNQLSVSQPPIEQVAEETQDSREKQKVNEIKKASTLQQSPRDSLLAVVQTNDHTSTTTLANATFQQLKLTKTSNSSTLQRALGNGINQGHLSMREGKTSMKAQLADCEVSLVVGSETGHSTRPVQPDPANKPQDHCEKTLNKASPLAGDQAKTKKRKLTRDALPETLSNKPKASKQEKTANTSQTTNTEKTALEAPPVAATESPEGVGKEASPMVVFNTTRCDLKLSTAKLPRASETPFVRASDQNESNVCKVTKSSNHNCDQNINIHQEPTIQNRALAKKATSQEDTKHASSVGKERKVTKSRNDTCEQESKSQHGSTIQNQPLAKKATKQENTKQASNETRRKSDVRERKITKSRNDNCEPESNGQQGSTSHSQSSAKKGTTKERTISKSQDAQTANTRAKEDSTSSNKETVVASATSNVKPKKKLNFQDQVLNHMLLAFKPFTLKTLATELNTTDTQLNYVMLSLVDKGIVRQKEFTSAKSGRSKTLYWALYGAKAKEVVVCMATPEELKSAKEQLEDLRTKHTALSRTLQTVNSEISNQELENKLSTEQEIVNQLSKQLAGVKTRIKLSKQQDAGATTSLLRKPPKSAAELIRERCPRRMKIRINNMRGEWVRRKATCTDLIEQMADGMEKKPKDVIKLLDVETDEMVGVKLPPKLVLDT